jgi:tRNA 2-thiouridine synthesizing protein D
MAKSIVVLLAKPPYGSEDAFAGTRLALAGMVSGAVGKTTVILIGDGTLNALETQRPGAIGMPSNITALQDIGEMEGEVLCVEEDLRSRAGHMKVIDGVRMISWEEARAVIREHQLVTTF